MTHVVTNNCVDCRYTSCVSECPVDAFKSHSRMLIIDPSLCIDCSMCIDLCPIDAIVTENVDLPDIDELISYATVAAQTWPAITKEQPTTINIKKCHVDSKVKP